MAQISADSFPDRICEHDIGAFVSSGKQHLVYSYQDNWVIKVPRHTWCMRLYGFMSSSTLQRDLKLLQQYFPEFLAPTQVIPHHNSYFILQKRIRGRPVTSTESPEVQEQLQLLWEANQRLKQEHRFFLDIFGFLGITFSSLSLVSGSWVQPRMTNILVEEGTNRIRIVDTNLATLHPEPHVNWLHASIDWWNVHLSHFFAHTQFALSESVTIQ